MKKKICAPGDEKPKEQRAVFDPASDGAEKLCKLGELSDKLGGMIDDALEDRDQFKRYIVSEKGRGEKGEAYTENVEKIFDKVDFKSMKEAAGAIKALAESVRCVYSVPGFCDTPDDEAGITVAFENGEEYAD
ncbi:MAG: hypothetical protein IKN38_06960 [Clostridia bacterium]|nr:hypothetical protein [Clostridia bacterium]